MKKILLGLLTIVVVLIIVVLYNTFTFKPDYEVKQAIPAPKVTDSALSHFQQAVSFKTISYADSSQFDSAAFAGFRRFLATAYPLVHRHLQLTLVEGHSLWYTWRGKDSAANPIILMAHQDVVPIEESTRNEWTVDPFGGVVKEGYIWGRGTTDDKINLIAIMETIEKLLSAGYVPNRNIHLLCGHDEEIGGKGAKAIAAAMEAMNLKADLLLDEGGIITREKVPGITQPIALLGTAEKGYLSLQLTAKATGGHSSMPDKETSVDILSQALVKLRSNPFPAKFTEPMEGLMKAVGPNMPFVQKMAFANPWLFKGLIVKSYEQSGAGNAMLHTTLVPTIIEAGIKDNVIPSQAKATINLRLLPGDAPEATLEKVKSIINDERVTVTYHNPANVASPSGVTSAKSFGYQKVADIVQQSYPGAIPSPFLMIGATDSRHFGKVSSNIIKFSPMVDPIGFHGINERVSIESFQIALWFYEQLLRDF